MGYLVVGESLYEVLELVDTHPRTRYVEHKSAIGVVGLILHTQLHNRLRQSHLLGIDLGRQQLQQRLYGVVDGGRRATLHNDAVAAHVERILLVGKVVVEHHHHIALTQGTIGLRMERKVLGEIVGRVVQPLGVCYVGSGCYGENALTLSFITCAFILFCF